MANWLNDISRDINNQIFERRLKSPSIQLKYKWHQEFLEKGLDKKQSFVSYLRYKTKQWHRQKKQPLNRSR